MERRCRMVMRRVERCRTWAPLDSVGVEAAWIEDGRGRDIVKREGKLFGSGLWCEAGCELERMSTQS